MTSTESQIDLSAVKERHRWTWASGDYSVIGARIVLMAERLVESAGLGARPLLHQFDDGATPLGW